MQCNLAENMQRVHNYKCVQNINFQGVAHKQAGGDKKSTPNTATVVNHSGSQTGFSTSTTPKAQSHVSNHPTPQTAVSSNDW